MEAASVTPQNQGQQLETPALYISVVPTVCHLLTYVRYCLSVTSDQNPSTWLSIG